MMLSLYLTGAIAAAFLLLVIKSFRFGLMVLIFALPAYLLRFKFGPLPSTILELLFAILFATWLFKYGKTDLKRIEIFLKQNKTLSILMGLFFLSSVVSIFISDMWWYSFGQWRAYFLEPMMLFFVLLGRSHEIAKDDLIKALSLSTLTVSSYGIVQKFTGIGFAPAWTDHSRVTSFFSSPNAVGLYLGPISLLMIAKIIQKKKERNSDFFIYLSCLVLSLATIFFTKSLGTVVGLFAGVFVLFAYHYRKATFYLTPIIATAFLLVILFTPLKSFIQSKSISTSNRFLLWQYSREYLTTSPKNFIFGTGIRQFFRKIQKPHYDPERMERLIYPHNIFLNFWTEIGLLGMLAFTGIVFLLFKGLSSAAQNNIIAAGVFSALAAVVVHGLIDVPYFKNDLSMLFWILSAISVTSYVQKANN